MSLPTFLFPFLQLYFMCGTDDLEPCEHCGAGTEHYENDWDEHLCLKCLLAAETGEVDHPNWRYYVRCNEPRQLLTKSDEYLAKFIFDKKEKVNGEFITPDDLMDLVAELVGAY